MMLRNSLFILGLLGPIMLGAQCIGTSGQVSWHYWEDIYHYDIEYLYVDDTYPQGPDKVRTLIIAQLQRGSSQFQNLLM